MKRLALAIALALSTAPLLADNSAPFEQTQLDRALPALADNVAASEPISQHAMPYEQAQIDRALPELPGTSERVQVAQLGGTSYRSADEGDAVAHWTTDHNFLAPPQ
jgi:hypothetical protein